jgi:hypothetical protein
MNSVPSSRIRALSLAAFLVVLAPRGARAENSISYKYEDYQEEHGRIAVKTHGVHVEQDLNTETHLKLDGILDAITGATPTGEPAPTPGGQVSLSELHPEHRKAWNLDLSRQFKRVNLSFGFGNSRESDYVSNGWSVNTVTDFNQKNTNLTLGLAGTDDKIKVLYSSRAPRARKHTNDVILGLSQLLNPDTSVTANVTWGRASGYLQDPYKLVEKDTQIFPGVFLPLTFNENRPDYREKWVALVGLNRSFREARGALDLSYRFYHDTFSTDAHTIDVAWFQRLGEKFILRPSLRWYEQSAPFFYLYTLNGTSITAVSGPPRTRGPFYSSDYRLSALRTVTYGLKLIWNVRDNLQFDVAYEKYDMQGRDAVTPGSAYADARIFTVGGKFSW